MGKSKGIAYGRSNFNEVVDQNFYYVDKTMYLPIMENKASYLFMIRPRRFGKSLFVSMMHSYYDLNQQDKFESRFENLWIGQHPTALKGRYQVLYFDFSRISGNISRLEEEFDMYCSIQLDGFMQCYRAYYDEQTVSRFFATNSSRDKMNFINEAARRLGHPLYLIIDEYDNFTNSVLSVQGNQVYHSLTHATGFYRDYFKLFKGMFDRIFMIGVSPVTLDDLTSGYNIDWNISIEPEFNAMLGFSETDVRQMFTYYQSVGELQGSIDEMIEEMHPWYDNYCFSAKCLSDERIFNCDMVLYYLNNRVAYNEAPEDMVDKNIRTDYSKLKMLVEIDRLTEGNSRLSTVQEIAVTGEALVTLKTSFPAEEIIFEDNFRSLLFYYGMLTISDAYMGMLRMTIPNNCVREQYYRFLIQYYQRTEDGKKLDLSQLSTAFMKLASKGEWRPFFEGLQKIYAAHTSVRNLVQGEHALQGFMKAFLSLADYYVLVPEIEMNHGYSDLFLFPNLQKYPDIAHSYLIELKYAKKEADDAQVAELRREAIEQLEKYSQDRLLIAACEYTVLHRLIILYSGWEMKVCEELLPHIYSRKTKK